MEANLIISIFQLIRTSEKYSPCSLCSLLCPCVGKSCIFWASLIIISSCIYVQVKRHHVFWIFLPVKGRRTSQFPIVLAVWSDAGWMPYGDHIVLDPVHHSSSLLPPSSPNQSTYCSYNGTDELWSAPPEGVQEFERPTRWCRCRQRWWLPSWEWSQWCPTWPRCSPPYSPCLGFPFPHHSGECLPFSLEKSAVFVSDQSGVSR